jgi:hypothetical protein
MSTEKNYEPSTQLVKDISDSLNAAWPQVLRDWQQDLRDMENSTSLESTPGPLALVTRRCSNCAIEVRVGQIVPNERMLSGRAFCRHCSQVHDGDVTKIEYLKFPYKYRKDESS